jgi:hypothetical protein
MILEPNRIFTRTDGTTKQGFYCDNTLYENLMHAQKMVENKMDFVSGVVGPVGAGKTTFAMTAAHIMDPDFNIDRVVFTAEQLAYAIDNAPKKSAIVLDESILTLSSGDGATRVMKEMIKRFTIIRFRRLKIFLVLPNFFQLQKWFAIDRTICLFHVYTPDGIQRGFGRFFSKKTKKMLYLLGQKTMNMSAVAPDFSFKFTNTENFFVDEKAYTIKKNEAVASLSDNSQSLEEEYKQKFYTKIEEMKSKVADWKSKIIARHEDEINALKQQMLDVKSQSIVDKKGKLELLEKQHSDLLNIFYNREQDLYRMNFPGKSDYNHTTFTEFLKTKGYDSNAQRIRNLITVSDERQKVQLIENKNSVVI